MNTEQEYQVKHAEGQVRQVRHTLEELQGFGWKASETAKPLQAFDAYRGRLAANQAAIDSLSPLEKNSKGRLSELLSEENLLVESLGKLAGEAAQALSDEELAFFDARDGLFDGIKAEIDEADNQIQQGLTWLIEGLQNYWRGLVKKQELAQRFQDISQQHSTPETFSAGGVSLPKPFAKLNHPIWGAFVASFCGRLFAILPNMETATPSDAVKTIFEKPAPPIDIGHDENSRKFQRIK